MILQALKEYYDRKAADPDSDIAPEGWEKKDIPFIIVLDRNGTLVRIEDTREGDGKKKKAKTFLVPRTVNRSIDIKANFLWDKAEYFLIGIHVNKDSSKLEKQRKAFAERVETLGDLSLIQPLKAFLTSIPSSDFSRESNWEEITKTNPNLSFRFEGETNLICRREEVIEQINKLNNSDSLNDDEKIGICLISGDKGVIARTHNKTPISRDNNSLFSFQKSCGYDSYGKEQGYNAPVSKSSESAYVTALNTLLKSARQRFSIGDASYVCWSKTKTNFETEFLKFFDDPETRDNPDLFSENVKSLFKSFDLGSFVESEGKQEFYLLGLSPGGGTRISIRFWDSKTISEYAVHIRQYFNDFAIIKPQYYPEYFSIWRILTSIAQQGESGNIPPGLAGEMMRAIINYGLPYPETIFNAAIRRIHAGIKRRTKNGEEIERVTPEIAATLKAYLNRFYKFHSNKNHKEVTMELDISQPSIGYQLGRLFSVLERIQEEANGSSTIRERFYGAACATPVTVFTNLLRLKNHHLAKLDNRGRAVYFERLLGEIIGRFNDFPAHLDLHEQGRFAIGYYHQRQAFFTKKDEAVNG